MPLKHDSKFAEFLRQYIQDSDEMELKELSEAIGGVSPTMLSRLRSGAQDAGSTVARRIARKLAATEAEQARIYREVLATRRDHSQAEATHVASGEASLKDVGFLVEFREKTAMNSPREGPQTTELVASWLLDGLHYAMFAPGFEDVAGVPAEEQQAGNVAVRKYLNSVHDDVLNSYTSLREEALRLLAEQHEYPGANELEVEANLLDSQLRLYMFPHDQMGAYPAFGFKLYLRAVNKVHVRFDWQAAPQGGGHPKDSVRERGELDRLEMDAIKARFFPVLQCFDRLKRLPTSNGELEKVASALRPQDSTHPWRVHEPKESVRELLDRLHRLQRLG